MKKIILLLVVWTQMIFAQAWQRTNGPLGGYVYCLVTKGSDIYAGTNAGVFVSKDNGQSWQAKSKGLPTCLFIRALDFYGNTFVAVSDYGIYVSNDNTANWTQTSIISAQAIKCIGSTFYAGGWDGVHVSYDLGQTWILASNGIPSQWHNYIGFSSFGSLGKYVFAGTYYGGSPIYVTSDNALSWTPQNNGFPESITYISSFCAVDSYLFAGTDQGVFLSTDTGLSWAAINNGLIDKEITALCSIGNNLFAGTSGGIFKSTNNGTGWYKINNGLTDTLITSMAAIDSGMFAATGHILRDNSDGVNLAAGYSPPEATGTVFRSDNLGASWVRKDSCLMDLSTQGITVMGSKIICGGVSGMFVSNDNGLTWSAQNNGISDLQIQAVHASGGYIYAGTCTGGIFVSSDSGLSWIPSNNGLASNLPRINSFYSEGSDVYAATSTAIYVSHNHGENWTSIAGGWFLSVIKRGNYLYGGIDGGLYVYHYHGGSWNYITNGINDGTIAVDAFVALGSIVYANAGNHLYHSNDSGATWIKDGHEPGFFCLYSMGSTLYGGSQQGVHLSLDSGNTWIVTDSSISNIYVYALAYNGSNLYAATNGSVWKSAIGTNSIKEFALSKSMKLYPNPAHDFIMIDIPAGVQYQFYRIKNALGENVSEEMFSKNSTAIRLNGLAPGVYFLELWDSNTHLTKRLVVE